MHLVSVIFPQNGQSDGNLLRNLCPILVILIGLWTRHHMSLDNCCTYEVIDKLILQNQCFSIEYLFDRISLQCNISHVVCSY